jgi:flagellar motor component MotA
MSFNFPSSPDIRYIKTLAKDIVKVEKRGSSGGVEILRQLHRFSSKSDNEILSADIKLSEVQYALALQYGYKSWKDLVTQIKERKMQINNFEQTVKHLDDRSLQKYLRMIDSNDLVEELLEGSEYVKARIFRNMSKRAVALVVNDMDQRKKNGKMKNNTFKKSLQIVQQLTDDGEIVLSNEEIPLLEDPVKEVHVVSSLKQQKKILSPERVNNLFKELSVKARKQGLLALQSDAEHIEDEYIKPLLCDVVDGTEPKLVEINGKKLKELLLEQKRDMQERIIAGVLQLQKDPGSSTADIEGDVFVTEMFKRLHEKVKEEGHQSIESDLGYVNTEPVLQTGLHLVADGVAPHLVKSICETKMEALLRKEQIRCDKILTGILGIQAGNFPEIIFQEMAAFD